MENSSIFRRFVEILKPNFLANNFHELDSSQTWKFWFLSNTIFTLIITVVASFGIYKFINESANYLQTKYPDAEISVKDGKISTAGLQEPVYVKNKDNSIFVLDTKGEKYDASVLNDVSSGVFISANKIYNKKNPVEIQQYDLSQIKNNFTFTQNDIQENIWRLKLAIILMVFVFAWIYLNAFRLVSALWWALIFWILGLIMRVKEMNFAKAYFAILNFYIIPLALTGLILMFGVSVPFLTFIIFTIIFILNYLNLKKQQELSEIEKAEGIK